MLIVACQGVCIKPTLAASHLASLVTSPQLHLGPSADRFTTSACILLVFNN
jgi:hypothetical protein